MANMARQDIEKRTVEVNRERLICTLKTNRKKHVQDYEEAKAGYKAVLLTKMDEAFEDAKRSIQREYERTKARVAELTDAEIDKQRDYFSLVEAINVEMKVPRSYAKEYDAAIDIAEWDVRETLELTSAEFTCFVRDQWDWKSEFDRVSTMYKSRP
jgi:hypothetical protein